ncbi:MULTISPECIES: hypothetical protein [unclassified Corynebacterium]|uniref:hypothetical protein n=1 Tax=unclassified Corynebacterium TaxID=2624378 RepID=UPI003098F7BD
MNTEPEATEAAGEATDVDQVDHPDQAQQPEIPGSSTADVVTLLFMAAMIIATVVCFIFLM